MSSLIREIRREKQEGAESERKDERIYLGLCRVRCVAIFRILFFLSFLLCLCLHCVPVMFCDAFAI